MLVSEVVLFVAMDKVNRYLMVRIECKLHLICNRELNFLKADESIVNSRVWP